DVEGGGDDGRAPPDAGEGDGGGCELARRLAAQRAQEAPPPVDEAGDVADEADDRDDADAEQRPGDDHGDGPEQDGQRLPGEALGAVIHAGAQDGGPEGDEGPDDGEPEPAEE